MKTALIVIDVQNAFAVENAANLPEKIAQHIQDTSYDHVLFTLYYYDNQSNFGSILRWQGPHESPNVDLHPLVAPLATPETTFSKTTYSAFKSKELLNFLNKNNISTIKLCGINIDACVLATAFEGFDLGFDIEILEDLSSISSTKKEYDDAAKVIIRRNLKNKSL